MILGAGLQPQQGAGVLIGASLGLGLMANAGVTNDKKRILPPNDRRVVWALGLERVGFQQSGSDSLPVLGAGVLYS